MGQKCDNTLFYCAGAVCWCVKDVTNVYCVDVKVLEENGTYVNTP